MISAGAGRRLRLSDRLLLGLEVRPSGSRAVVPIADGEAALLHLALHMLGGLIVRV